MLLDAKPPKPPGGIRKYVPLWLLILIIFLVSAIAALLAVKFWNYREEHAVARFLTTLEEGNYQKAYQLWQPASSYQFQDFMHDWGPQGDYGKIHSFDILGSSSLSGPTVVVTVSINGMQPPLDLVVNAKTLGLAYSPF
jgi:hypothetical protein